MKFVITMNMPASGGNPIHTMVVDYPAKTLEEMQDVLAQHDFLLFDEYYSTEEKKTWYLNGKIIINTMLIGKVRLADEKIKIVPKPARY